MTASDEPPVMFTSPFRPCKWKWTGFTKGYYGDYRLRAITAEGAWIVGVLRDETECVWAVERIQKKLVRGQYAYKEVNRFTSRDEAKNFVETTHELACS